MKTQDNDTLGTQPTFQSPTRTPRTRRKSWLAGVGAFIVVALIIGASAVVFAQLGQHHSTQAKPTAVAPANGRWEQVLKGYALTSLVAAQSNPAVIYACATPRQSSNQPGGPLTVLRSTDLGTHWQDIGSKVALTDSCQLTVNPANSNEVYAVTGAVNLQSPEILQHSTDGGQTWETIHPTLRMPPTPPIPWSTQQIHLEGSHLFALQWVPRGPTPYGQVPVPFGSISRLITSTDGGHTWTVLDSQLIATHLGTFDYAIDPVHTSTIYELLGLAWIPPIEKSGAADVLLSFFGTNEKLYKSTDGGTTWHLLLDSLPFGSRIQLASNKPGTIYVGGSISPLPLASQYGASSQEPFYAGDAGTFRLRISSDGGATWRNITPPPNLFGYNDWFVSADGQVYLGSLYAGPTTQPTAISGTAVPATRVVQPTVPQAYVGPATKDGVPTGESLMNARFPSVNSVPTIQHYDPTTDKWSSVSQPPLYGRLVEVTPTTATGGAVLWFMGNREQILLYRYVA